MKGYRWLRKSCLPSWSTNRTCFASPSLHSRHGKKRLVCRKTPFVSAAGFQHVDSDFELPDPVGFAFSAPLLTCRSDSTLLRLAVEALRSALLRDTCKPSTSLRKRAGYKNSATEATKNEEYGKFSRSSPAGGSVWESALAGRWIGSQAAEHDRIADNGKFEEAYPASTLRLLHYPKSYQVQ